MAAPLPERVEAPGQPAADRRAAPREPELEAPAAGEPAPAATFFSSLRYLGQLDRTYLLCEAAGELVLIDQHAAHERVAFQRLRERYGEQHLPVQRLLFPHDLELSPEQAAAAAEARAELAAVGFELARRRRATRFAI